MSPSPSAACLSPLVMAPSCCIRRETAATKRCSPPTSVTSKRKEGAYNWLLRCTRPNCCTAFSADQGSSRISMTRFRADRLSLPSPALLSACSEMPALAASVMIATRFSPCWNACCSLRFTWSQRSPSLARFSRHAGLLPEAFASRNLRPESSATFSCPPSCRRSWSRGLSGRTRSWILAKSVSCSDCAQDSASRARGLMDVSCKPERDGSLLVLRSSHSWSGADDVASFEKATIFPWSDSIQCAVRESHRMTALPSTCL
mmetsp:Transcript_95315/g.169219  ORF Transcript_95315/g.169219 Transcript_95315/m.169219 type:complete len:260 (+) Transcript_95315:1850-2629(+)